MSNQEKLMDMMAPVLSTCILNLGPIPEPFGTKVLFDMHYMLNLCAAMEKCIEIGDYNPLINFIEGKL